jgi:hypothetical protein
VIFHGGFGGWFLPWLHGMLPWLPVQTGDAKYHYVVSINKETSHRKDAKFAKPFEITSKNRDFSGRSEIARKRGASESTGSRAI